MICKMIRTAFTLMTLNALEAHCWKQHDHYSKSGKAHFKRDALGYKTRALIYSDRIQSAA